MQEKPQSLRDEVIRISIIASLIMSSAALMFASTSAVMSGLILLLAYGVALSPLRRILIPSVPSEEKEESDTHDD